MRVAVSDYDGTLSTHGVVREGALNAVREWRRAGNIFGIATGRDLSMITHETRRNGLEYDFLVCCNGAALYDRELEVLQSQDLEQALVPQILTHPAAQASLHYELCSNGLVFLVQLSPDSWFPGLGVPYGDVTLEEAMGMKKLQQISLAYKSAEEAAHYADLLEKSFVARLTAHHNGSCLDITRNGADKAAGILEVLRQQHWPDRDVLTIGDSANDLPMLRHFNGYAILGSDQAIKAQARGVYESVGAMLREHLKNGVQAAYTTNNK